jgi:glycine hydroxymethyltransferase
MTDERLLEQIRSIKRAGDAYRARTLNLIASENVISTAVAAALAGDLEGRYADYDGTDLTARKYRGGRYVVEGEKLCEQLLLDAFPAAEACELRSLSGHIAGSAVLMGLCQPGDLVMEIGPNGGGHRLAAKLAQAPLIDLKVEFLPFDGEAFNVDVSGAQTAIRSARPRVVVLGSSTFLHPHPVAPIAEACAEIGAPLVYDGSHVMGLLVAGRFQHPLEEGADLIFGSTHKTLFGPQGGIIVGRRDLVERASAGLYPPLVTNHHPFRLPALAVALAEHQAFGSEYADQTVANAQAFSAALADAGEHVVGGVTESHAVLVATPGRSGAEVARQLEERGVITNASRPPEPHGDQGLRFGLQELTRRGADETVAAAAASLVSRGIAGEEVDSEVQELVGSLPGVSYTWSAPR